MRLGAGGGKGLRMVWYKERLSSNSFTHRLSIHSTHHNCCSACCLND